MDYILIRAWGRFNGTMAFYVRQELDRARDDNAPGNVIYKREDGTWATLNDLSEPNRTKVAQIAGQIRPGHKVYEREIYEDQH